MVELDGIQILLIMLGSFTIGLFTGIVFQWLSERDKNG